MAWLNDIPVPSSQPYTGKKPELDQHSSIMIDGNNEDNKLNQHEVTFKDFLNTSTRNLNSFMENSKWSMNDLKMWLKTAKPD